MGLDSGAFGPHLRQAEKGIPLGSERDEALATDSQNEDQREIEEQVEWKKNPKQKTWHVFYKNPDHVPMPMVSGEGAALVSRAGGADMAHDGIVHE